MVQAAALSGHAQPRRRRRPSSGFVTVCLVYAALAVFFAWGLSTPDLDRVWTLHHELKAGYIGAPSKRDRRVIERSMAEHAELADALLRDDGIGLISSNAEGWIASSDATIVRTRKAHGRALQVEVASPQALLPLELVLEGPGWHERHKLEARGVHDIALPPMKSDSELIVLELKGRAAHADASVLGVRVTFAPAKAGT